MSPKTFALKHYNNTTSLFNTDAKLFTARWFMDFGKMGSEVFDIDENVLYEITKKFQFWKWKMVFTIKDKADNTLFLTSTNNRKTIYDIALNNTTYSVKIQYKRKTSVFKNDTKIAEFDASFTEEDRIRLKILNETEIQTVFLLFSCMQIGETEQSGKSLIASQKQLEINSDPWF